MVCILDKVTIHKENIYYGEEGLCTYSESKIGGGHHRWKMFVTCAVFLVWLTTVESWCPSLQHILSPSTADKVMEKTGHWNTGESSVSQRSKSILTKFNHIDYFNSPYQ